MRGPSTVQPYLIKWTWCADCFCFVTSVQLVSLVPSEFGLKLSNNVVVIVDVKMIN